MPVLEAQPTKRIAHASAPACNPKRITTPQSPGHTGRQAALKQGEANRIGHRESRGHTRGTWAKLGQIGSMSCAEKDHPHNLKVVGSNPTPATNEKAR